MKISSSDFFRIVEALGDTGQADIEWAESLALPCDADCFAREAIFVICNSGMRFTVAQGIYSRCMDALDSGRPVISVFGHAGKVHAIETIWRNRVELLAAFLKADDKLDFLVRLPWIGDITKYHLAKNFGIDVAKPDVHLQRIADLEGCSAQALCERIAAETGLRVATVDTLLWRACATGVINSRTGEVFA